MRKGLKIRPQIEAMKVGTTIEFPIERISSVRALASNAGLIFQRTYRTESDARKRVVSVTRVS